MIGKSGTGSPPPPLSISDWLFLIVNILVKSFLTENFKKGTGWMIKMDASIADDLVLHIRLCARIFSQGQGLHQNGSGGNSHDDDYYYRRQNWHWCLKTTIWLFDILNWLVVLRLYDGTFRINVPPRVGWPFSKRVEFLISIFRMQNIANPECSLGFNSFEYSWEFKGRRSMESSNLFKLFEWLFLTSLAFGIHGLLQDISSLNNARDVSIKT